MNNNNVNVVGAYTKEEWILGGASGRMITTKSGYFGDGFIADVDTKANAELICKAVNNHFTLLEALKQSQAVVEYASFNAPLSGKLRNEICDTNIKVLEAIKNCEQ